MTVGQRPPAAAEESFGEREYRELAEEHAARAYGLVVLLVGEATLALEIARQGYERTWDAIRRDIMVGDTVDSLYWTVTRNALRRVSRSRGELRGLLPPTTADDNQITAFGIVSAFPAQQQAAIYLAAWARVGYRLAGLASGVGESRARDLVFSARQEYREARGGGPDNSTLCREASPLLSARADGEPVSLRSDLEQHVASCAVCRQAAALFEEFSASLRGLRIPTPPESPTDRALAVLRERPERHRFPRIVRLMFGPAILVVILIATLVFLRGFGEPEITTGAGRTSDLLFARDPSSAIVILDSGSGRVLGRLPDGILAKNGQRVYGVSTTCQEEGSCTSTVRVTDTATMASNPVGRLDGRLALLGVDEARGRLYLTDSEGTRLLFFDSSLGQTVQTIDQPESFVAAFAPRGAVLSADGSTLFTLGGSSDGEAAAVVTDLLTGRVQRPIPLPGSPDEFAGQLQASGRLYAYRLSEGAVFEIDPVIAQVLGSVQLDAGGGSPPSGSETGLLVATSQGSLIYAIVSSGGIASLRTDQFQLVNRLAPDRRFRSISVSSDGSLLYTIEIDGGYSVFQASSGQQMLHRSNVNASALLQANAGE